MLRKSSCSMVIVSFGLLSSLAHAQSAVGLKNYRQLLYSFAQITGIPASDSTVQAQFNAVLTRLPTQGDIGELSTPTVLAVATLGGAFCSRMIAVQSAITDATTRTYFKNVDFTKLPSQITDTVKESVVTDLVHGFWQREPTSTEMVALMTALNMGMTGEPDTVATFTAGIQRTCGAVAASLDSIAY